MSPSLTDLRRDADRHADALPDNGSRLSQVLARVGRARRRRRVAAVVAAACAVAVVAGGTLSLGGGRTALPDSSPTGPVRPTASPAPSVRSVPVPSVPGPPTAQTFEGFPVWDRGTRLVRVDTFQVTPDRAGAFADFPVALPAPGPGLALVVPRVRCTNTDDSLYLRWVAHSWGPCNEVRGDPELFWPDARAASPLSLVLRVGSPDSGGELPNSPRPLPSGVTATVTVGVYEQVPFARFPFPARPAGWTPSLAIDENSFSISSKTVLLDVSAATAKGRTTFELTIPPNTATLIAYAVSAPGLIRVDYSGGTIDVHGHYTWAHEEWSFGTGSDRQTQVLRITVSQFLAPGWHLKVYGEKV